MSWYKVHFSEESTASGKHISFEFEIALALGYSAAPVGADVYFREDDHGRTYFFSPVASTTVLPLISHNGGEQSQAPALEELKVFTISSRR
jgi:hypothetical protein